MLKVGYSYWGFLGDHKIDKEGNELSTPDGNATYSWSIIWEMLRRDWDVWMMQEDRDWPAFQKYGRYNFDSFCGMKRHASYLYMHRTGGTRLPELDVLFLEWRFPVDGRNCDILPDGMTYYNPAKHQPDLERQLDLISFYRDRGTKIIVWDLDHKLTVEDEMKHGFHAIFETSHTPRRLTRDRVRVEFPTITRDLLEHATVLANPSRKMVYVGSRYERDDVIQEYLEPVSRKWPGQIEFWGNWTREPNLSECKKMWPHFSYNGRITTKDFRRVYADAVSCPLLAKRSYIETGFVTPRVWEALQFGTIPVGIKSMKGIDRYVQRSAADAAEFTAVTEELAALDLPTRDKLRRENVEKIQFMDAKHFIDKIAEV